MASRVLRKPVTLVSFLGRSPPIGSTWWLSIVMLLATGSRGTGLQGCGFIAAVNE